MKTIVSVAVSIDGFIDDSSTQRLILSNDEDWQAVYDLRSDCDAILVGANTIRKDNPSLSIRNDDAKQRRVAQGLPEEIVKVTISKDGDIDPQSRFFTAGDGQKIVYHSNRKIPNGVRYGAEFVFEEKITALFVRDDLAHRGYKTLLVEGGSAVLSMFFTEGVVDELRLAVAPFFVGDAAAPRFIENGQFPFNKNRRMELMDIERLGDMAIMHYRLKNGDR